MIDDNNSTELLSQIIKDILIGESCKYLGHSLIYLQLYFCNYYWHQTLFSFPALQQHLISRFQFGDGPTFPGGASRQRFKAALSGAVLRKIENISFVIAASGRIRLFRKVWIAFSSLLPGPFRSESASMKHSRPRKHLRQQPIVAASERFVAGMQIRY